MTQKFSSKPIIVTNASSENNPHLFKGVERQALSYHRIKELILKGSHVENQTNLFYVFAAVKGWFDELMQHTGFIWYHTMSVSRNGINSLVYP